MRQRIGIGRHAAMIGGLIVLAAFSAGCGTDSTPEDQNLLVNSSFEEVEGDLPVGWELKPFRGLEGSREAAHGIDTEYPFDGDRSFFLKADDDTRRFFTLTQEVKVKNVERIRLRGAVRALDVRRAPEQYPQANFALTFYDKYRNRYYSTRFYDKRTRPRLETSVDWIEEELVVRLPANTAYIEVHCALGMSGTMWFDNLVLEVPTDIAWQTSESANFTFHWLPGSEYPDGSREYQQELFDNYANRLGIPVAERPHIFHYLYPDSAALYKAIGSKAPIKSFWDSREVHSIHPVDNHEIIHILTQPYGILPFGLTEGTAYYLIGFHKGRPVQELAYELLVSDRLPSVRSVIEPFSLRQMDPDLALPAAATFVGFLLEFGGPQRFLDFHRAANNKRSFEEFSDAFEEVYGRSLAEMASAWRQVLGSLEFSDSTRTGTGE